MNKAQVKKQKIPGKLPYKYMIGLCVLILVSALAAAFILYTWFDYGRETRETAGREARYMVTQVVSQVDERLTNLQQYYLFAVEEDDIKWIMENDLHYSDYSRYKAAADVMASVKLFGDYIDGFTFVNYQTDWVLSSKGMFPLWETYNEEALNELFERNNDSVDKNYWIYDSTVVITNTVDRKYRVTVETGGLTLVVKLPLSNKNVYGMLAVNINMNTWKNWIKELLYAYEDVAVTDGEGNLIYTTSESFAAGCAALFAAESTALSGTEDAALSDEETTALPDVENAALSGAENIALSGVEKSVLPGTESTASPGADNTVLSDMGNTAGWQILRTQGQLYAVAAGNSGVLGWHYYVGYDMNNGQLAGFHLSWLRLLALALLMLNGLVISSYIIYRPVGRLVHDVAEGHHQIDGDELSFLANRFVRLRDDNTQLKDDNTQLKDNNQSLETALTQQRDKLLELFELRLVRGEVRSADEWNEYFYGLHLKNCSCFAAVVLVLNLRGENETQDNVDEDALCLKLVEELPSQLKELTWMPPVYNACTIFSLLGSDDEEELLTQVTQFFEGVQRFVETVYGFRMLMGVSATHTDYRHIRAAYRESINALTLPELHTAAGEDCHFYLSSSTVHGSAYNYSFEQDIQTGIKAMDKVQCYNVIDEFCRYLKEVPNHDDAVVYVLRFVNTILVTAIDTRLGLEKLFPDGLRKIYREIIEAIEPNRVRRYMKWALIDPILAARNEMLENTSYSMMEAIEGKIAECRGNITLTECADALGVHPTYIWKVLKMEKGQSFTDYLEDYKIEEAKRLLLQTGMTVADIAVELNYANAQNFIRFFSKKTGITPGKFRKLY